MNNPLTKIEPDLFNLYEAQLESFKKFVETKFLQPILALAQLGLHNSFDTDASNYSLGYTLFQIHKTDKGYKQKLLGYWS